ncbi:hypothetical protein L195_g064138, partial [Trifolium pratense]
AREVKWWKRRAGTLEGSRREVKSLASLKVSQRRERKAAET